MEVHDRINFPCLWQITYSVPFAVTAELTADSGGGQGWYQLIMMSLICGLLKFLISRCLLGCVGLAIGVLNLAIVVPQVVYCSEVLLSIIHPFLEPFGVTELSSFFLFCFIIGAYVHIAMLICNLLF